MYSNNSISDKSTCLEHHVYEYKSPKLITAYLEKSKKRNNSVLSLMEQEHQSKKLNKGNMEMEKYTSEDLVTNKWADNNKKNRSRWN